MITYISRRPSNIHIDVVMSIGVGQIGDIIPQEVPVPLNADATSNIDPLME
jgi:hypothetical protein